MKWIAVLLLTVSEFALSQTRDSSKALELNNRAVKLYNDSSRAPSVAKAVLLLYDQAIAADSLCVAAYWNKANLLCQLGQRKKALATVDRLVAIHPEAVYQSLAGPILERMGRFKEAKKRYLADITKLDSIIASLHDTLTIEAQISKAFLIMLVNGKQAGIQAYQKIAARHPTSTFVVGQEAAFEYFDRQQYIRDCCK